MAFERIFFISRGIVFRIRMEAPAIKRVEIRRFLLVKFFSFKAYLCKKYVKNILCVGILQMI